MCEYRFAPDPGRFWLAPGCPVPSKREVRSSHKQTSGEGIAFRSLFTGSKPLLSSFFCMSSPYPYGQYPPPPPPNPYFQGGGGYPYSPQGYYQPACVYNMNSCHAVLPTAISDSSLLSSPPPQVMYAPPAYQYHNDNTCCWAW